ncbi:MAG: HesA/MoeB/ThiF family protein [Bacteroidia bacterium]|nr:HesA/MoeB/ThiF family protein [Bacteroidia bacterium]
MILPEIGTAGQEKLSRARVLVVGAGGLGCPLLLYLAAAGVGHIGIADGDLIDSSNLHRQILYGAADVGTAKALAAKAELTRKYPGQEFEAYPFRIDNANALDLVADYDIIVDGSDNFSTRYLLNDACVIADRPLVYGAVTAYEGQVAVFNDKTSGVPASNYRDLFPVPPATSEIMNCEEAGVLGVIPGTIGMLQANEVLKIITRYGDTLGNKILTIRFTDYLTQVFSIPARPETPAMIPAGEEAFRKYNYPAFCNEGAEEDTDISADDFLGLVPTAVDILLDVREEHTDLPELGWKKIHIPLQELESRSGEIGNAGRIVLVCQSGIRSKTGVQILRACFPSGTFYSIDGGLGKLKLKLKDIHSL